MSEIRILGIRISDRSQVNQSVQNILTKYGCTIKTRLGLHEVVEDNCSPEGIILLELLGLETEMDLLEKELRNLPGVEVQKMIFQ
jgi:hypothetical protein